MRKWLVEETGEGIFDLVRVTEIEIRDGLVCDIDRVPWKHYDHPLSDRFEEWNW
jgi:hypothetical protein